MLETDAPYLTPHPHRGQRNEPAYVALVCAQLARLYGVTVDAMAADSTALALRFYGLAGAGDGAHAGVESASFYGPA
jgi:TatD DNase family protein